MRTESPGQLGQLLRTARKAREMTLKQLSAASGLSVTYLSDLERGTLRNPSLGTLRSVAEAMGLTANDLLGVRAESGPGVLPGPLEQFRSSIGFVGAIERDAAMTSVDPYVLEADWLKVLSGIRIMGQSPRDSADYQFVFEAIRRALGTK